MTLKVIGAGFGRTGTDSMREALTLLGFGPCHHMFEVNAHEEQKRLWRALVRAPRPTGNGCSSVMAAVWTGRRSTTGRS
jgi:Sulfotransferase domain